MVGDAAFGVVAMRTGGWHGSLVPVLAAAAVLGLEARLHGEA